MMYSPLWLGGLQQSGFDVDAQLAKASRPQSPGLAGTVEAEDPKAATDRICEMAQWTLHRLVKAVERTLRRLAAQLRAVHRQREALDHGGPAGCPRI